MTAAHEQYEELEFDPADYDRFSIDQASELGSRYYYVGLIDEELTR
jgi:hypothetical protein